MAKLTITEARMVIDRMRPTWQIMNEIKLSTRRDKKPPELIFSEEMSCYYDPRSNRICIGWLLIYHYLDTQTEEEFAAGVEYIIAHEQQHYLSTASKPFVWSMTNSYEYIIEYIATQVGDKPKFRKEADYEEYVDHTLPDIHGLYISKRMLADILHGVVNSLEDGRIERIASKERPFTLQKRAFRGKIWLNSETDRPDPSQIEGNKAKMLPVIANEILSLSTAQVYTKGFASEYDGTETKDFVDSLMPDIAQAIMAKETKKMAEHSIKICKALAPYIYDACKAASKDEEVRQAFEKMLADLIKSMVDNLPDNMELSEKDESGDDDARSTFPSSDLTITLDDETYDKLMEKMEKSDDRSGINIRREHPKPEQKDPADTVDIDSDGKDNESDKNSAEGGKPKDSKKTDGSSTDDGSDPDKGEGSDGTTEASDKTGKNGNDAGNTKDSKGSSTKPTSNDSSKSDADTGGDNPNSSSAGKSSDKGKDSTQDPAAKQDESLNESSSHSTIAAAEDASRSAAKDKDADIKKSTVNESEIRKASEEAAKAAAIIADSELSRINERTATESRRGVKEVPDSAKPLTMSDVKDLMRSYSFKEVKRAYKLKDNLPPVVAARGRTMKRANDRYYKSLSTPNVRYLDSGTVDPGRIFALGIGDTNIFRKKGKDKKFDGCAYILIDNSGSMAGNKRSEACKAAAVIEEGFRGIMPFKIVAFDYWGGVIHEVVKGWDESTTKNACWNFCLYGRQGCGNADAYDIAVAARELSARPERKKLLVVLSDGMPTEATEAHTKKEIENARKAGIKVCGIYFEEGEVGYDAAGFKGMYEKDYVCCELSQLDKELSKILKVFSRS